MHVINSALYDSRVITIKFLISARHLTILTENKLKLIFSASKMNLFRQKIIFHIVVIDDEIYFVISLKRLYLQYFSKFDEFFFQARTNQSFIVKYVINVFCNKFKNLNIVDYYSKYFFRRNVVTSTRQINFSNFTIQLFDR